MQVKRQALCSTALAFLIAAGLSSGVSAEASVFLHTDGLTSNDGKSNFPERYDFTLVGGDGSSGSDAGDEKDHWTPAPGIEAEGSLIFLQNPSDAAPTDRYGFILVGDDKDRSAAGDGNDGSTGSGDGK